MLVGTLNPEEVRRQLDGNGLRIEFGPFNVRIRSNLRMLASLAHELYGAYPVSQSGAIADFHVEMSSPRGLRRWVRPQARFRLDGRAPFAPYSAEHAFPGLEWGINWCIATRAHHLLMLHSAVIERDGRAVLFPAWPGHGKSTLCAALIHSGWRLLSDEFGLIRPEDGALLPMPRLIPLKNESIEVIRRFSPQAVIGPAFHGTRKGTVAHLQPPLSNIRLAHEPARAHCFVFPRWISGERFALEPMAKSEAFLMVATNAFNYEVLDEQAFRLVAAMVDACECYSLRYSELSEAVTGLENLWRAR